MNADYNRPESDDEVESSSGEEDNQALEPASPFESDNEDMFADDDVVFDEIDTESTESGRVLEEDALTWDTVSVKSEEEVKGDDDEWYPMSSRRMPMPNFAMPTTTRQVLTKSTSNNDESTTAPRSFDPPGPPETSQESFVGVMRPIPTRDELMKVVLDYFLHHGHSEVVETFCNEMGLPLPTKEIEEMNERNVIRDLIWAGKMEEAMEAFPPCVMEDPHVEYVVRKQYIIEMIRNGQVYEPVHYFRTHFMEDGHRRPRDERMVVLEQIFTLMVLNPGDQSEFHFYYDQKERELTARVVNSALLGAKGKSKASKIDLLANSIIWMRHETSNKTHPKSNSTTKYWAEKFFNAPFGNQDLIEKAPLDGPYALDEGSDLC